MTKKSIKLEVAVPTKLSPKNRAVLRVGQEQLERYDEALRELAGKTTAKRDDHDDA